MEMPSNHQGIPRPPRKNSDVLFPAVLEATHPIIRTMEKKTPRITQSIVISFILPVLKRF
jgi:hypothetical protein